jgi:chemotaxis protein CheX
MDSRYVMPFVKAAQNVFETMLQMPVQVGAPTLKSGHSSYDVSGIIAMSGDVEGSVVLSFPTATAQRVIALFSGAALETGSADFADAVGELVNMISGGAKAQFPGKQVNISCPSVVVGPDHIVLGQKDAVCILIPCTCDCGEFAIEVSFKRVGAATAAAALAPTAAAGN